MQKFHELGDDWSLIKVENGGLGRGVCRLSLTRPRIHFIETEVPLTQSYRSHLLFSLKHVKWAGLHRSCKVY